MEKISLLLHDTELNLDELFDVAMQVAAAGTMGVATGAPLAEVLKGLWVDGLVTGLYIAKGRSE